MRYRRANTPAYLIWVVQRPSTSGKGKEAYLSAVKVSAACEIAEPITVADIEVEVVYSTTAKPAERMDTDNINKPTLDALKGVAYVDDAQVRSVTATIFDKTASHHVEGRVEHLGQLFYSPNPDVILIMIYSDSRLRDLGGEPEVQRRRYAAWQQNFDTTIARIREHNPV